MLSGFFILGDFSDVYISNFALAKFFQAPEDIWLADHFFENCLTYSSLIPTDEGMRTAEARCQVGLSAERQGILVHLYNYGTVAGKFLKFSTSYLLTYTKSSVPNLYEVGADFGQHYGLCGA